MNILFICDEYPPGKIGGIGTMVQVLSRELVKQGHNVFVVGLYAYSYGGKNYEEDQGVKVWRMRYGLNLRMNEYHFSHKAINKIPDFIKKHLNGKAAFNRFISFIHSLIDQESIEIIEIPDWNTFALRIGFLVKWPSFKVPLVLKSHGSYTKICYDLNKRPKEKWARVDDLLFKRADALSAVSHNSAKINKMLFKPVTNIEVLYNGIQVNNESNFFLKEERTIIYTGTLTASKGIYQLLRAWNLVVEKFPDVRLMIFGKGEVEPLIKLLSNNTIHTVCFKGHVKREILLHQLAKSTLAVFPSYSETFGLGVVEAMSVGCPVIFTNRSCGPEIVEHQKEGILVDPDNLADISQAIIDMLSNSIDRKKMSLAAYKKVKETFSIEIVCKQHLEYYKKVIQSFKKNLIPNV